MNHLATSHDKKALLASPQGQDFQVPPVTPEDLKNTGFDCVSEQGTCCLKAKEIHHDLAGAVRLVCEHYGPVSAEFTLGCMSGRFPNTVPS